MHHETSPVDFVIQLKTAPVGLVEHWCLDIAQHALYRGADRLKKAKFQQAIDLRRLELLDGVIQKDIIDIRKPLLRSVSHYQKNADTKTYSDAVRSILAAVFDDPRTQIGPVYGPHLTGASYWAVRSATSGTPTIPPDMDSEMVVLEKAWQRDRFDFLLDYASKTSRFWMLYQEPKKLPFPVPENCRLDYFGP